jgi:hypothetical protein
MNALMALLYLGDTNHVLASFTRGAEPVQPDTAPDAFVGDGLHVRVGADPTSAGFASLDFVVPAAHLKFAEAGLDALVIKGPRNYGVDSNKQPILFSSGSLVLTKVAAKITIPAVTTGATTCAVLIQPWTGGATLYQNPALTPAAATILDLSTLPSGNYHVLVCVPGYPLALIEVVV